MWAIASSSESTTPTAIVSDEELARPVLVGRVDERGAELGARERPRAGVDAQFHGLAPAAPRSTRGRNSAATPEWTSSDSAALHTPGRCVLAFTAIATASSRSAVAST